MPLLLLKDLPRYECLLEAARAFPDLDPSACEAYLHLLRTSDEVFRVVEANFVRHGLTPGRFIVLMLLLDKEKRLVLSLTPAQLADKAKVTRATMTGLIDTLERDGMVSREPDPSDRRMLLVRMTPKGESALLGLLPSHFQKMAGLMRALSANERKTLVRLLGKVSEQAGVLEAGAKSVPETAKVST